jgi:hypothetical protein
MLKEKRAPLIIIVLFLFVVSMESCGRRGGEVGNRTSRDTLSQPLETMLLPEPTPPPPQISITDDSGQATFLTSHGQVVTFEVRDSTTQQPLSNISVTFSEEQGNTIIATFEDLSGNYVPAIYADNIKLPSVQGQIIGVLAAPLIIPIAIGLVTTGSMGGEAIGGMMYMHDLINDRTRIGILEDVRCITVIEFVELLRQTQSLYRELPEEEIKKTGIQLLSHAIPDPTGGIAGEVAVIITEEFLLLSPEEAAKKIAQKLYEREKIRSPSPYEIVAVEFYSVNKKLMGKLIGYLFKHYRVVELETCENQIRPLAPQNLTAKAVSPTQINLTWNDVRLELAYILEYSTDGVNFKPVEIGLDKDATTFLHQFLSPNTTYYYRIYAINSAGHSLPSNIAQATTLPAPNQLPVISSIIANPLPPISPNESLTLICNASDPDGDNLVYLWNISGGRVSDPRARVTTWTAPSTPGTYTVTCRVSDGKGGIASRGAHITVTQPTIPLSIITTSLSSGTVGVLYGTNLSATGGKTPYKWSIISGSLPPGLTLSTSGLISGTPTTAGTYNFTVKVRDSSLPQQTASKTLAITITEQTIPLSITTTSLPSGTVGNAYTESLSATGGKKPYSWSIVSGSLPSGLSLDTGGIISGTPTKAGTYNFTIKVADSSSPQQTATKVLSIVINSPPSGILQVTPSGGLVSSGPQDGPFSPSSKTYTLSNIGGSSINWTASKGQSWVSLSSTSGTLSPGASTTITVSINNNANNLGPNSYSDVIYFTNTTNGKGNTSRSVNLTVTQIVQPDLIVENIWTEPDPPIAADYATIYIRIKNQGSRNATGTFFLEFYFDGTYKGRVYINGLAAGATKTSYWRAEIWPSDTNLHTIKGVVDSDNVVSESNENNNEYSIQVRATKPPIGTGTLKIESNPSGAKVYIDGEYKGETPLSGYLTISNLTAGDHTLKVTKSGYKDWIGTVTIPSGGTKYEAVILEPDKPDPPTPTYPGSSSAPGPTINTLTPTFKWKESLGGAEYYALAISKYPYGSSNIVYNPQQIYGTFITVPSGYLKWGTKYRWNMQAYRNGEWSAISKTLYFQTSTISARIDSYYPNNPNNPVQVQVGNSTTIKVTFTNTGNTAWSFITGATIWDSNGNQVVNYSKTLSTPLQPGQQTTVSWSHSVNNPGDYWLQFGVWKATPFTAENLLDKKPSPSQRLIRGISTITERITNGSFSSGTNGWTLWGDFWAGTNFLNYRTSPGYAAGGVDSSGYPKNNAVGYMYQTVSIPSNATTATLSFWYNITSEETVSTAHDVLNVTIQDSSGKYLAMVAILSNLNKGTLGVYRQKTFDVTPYKGQTIRVNFLVTTDSSNTTVFRIDDVSIMADGN